MNDALGTSTPTLPKEVGLRDDLDDSDVLVCEGHHGAPRHTWTNAGSRSSSAT